MVKIDNCSNCLEDFLIISMSCNTKVANNLVNTLNEMAIFVPLPSNLGEEGGLKGIYTPLFFVNLRISLAKITSKAGKGS